MSELEAAREISPKDERSHCIPDRQRHIKKSTVSCEYFYNPQKASKTYTKKEDSAYMA